MKEIKLTQGKVALVDDEDFEYLNQRKWHYSKGYAVSTSRRLFGFQKTIAMHREIMNTPNGMETDHINGDKLDNRKNNLRNCFHLENGKNRKIQINNTSNYKGVSFDKRAGKWRSVIYIEKKKISLGNFTNIEDAARAYDKKAIELFGEFANTNF